MNESQYAQLKKVIHEANPEKLSSLSTFRLADVLLAMGKRDDFHDDNYLIYPTGKFGYHMQTGNTGIYWNLKNDSLDSQPDKTKQFLYDLLVTLEKSL